MTDPSHNLPSWALALLRCPQTSEALSLAGHRLIGKDGLEAGRLEAGIVRMPLTMGDDNIRLYKEVGGAHFWERAKVPFAMSALDTPIYHGHLKDVRPQSSDDVIVDVGGGDGRNARLWLAEGFRRVVVVDAVADGLARFRARIAAEAPEWLDRLLLVEADARHLPLASDCAATVLAIEALCYLNQDYEHGLRECIRLLRQGGRILVSERDYEGGLILRLLYGGIDGMLEVSRSRTLVDGPPDALMHTRCFTEAELVGMLTRNGMRIASVKGMSLLTMLLGWMQGKGMVGANDEARLSEITSLLGELGRDGRVRRCNIAVAERSG